MMLGAHPTSPKLRGVALGSRLLSLLHDGGGGGLKNFFGGYCKIGLPLTGGGREYRKNLKWLYMVVVIMFFVFLVLVSAVPGYIGSYEIDLGIELNRLNSPFYRMGIFSEQFILEDGSSEHQLTIGLFFVNFVVVFWKPNNSNII